MGTINHRFSLLALGVAAMVACQGGPEGASRESAGDASPGSGYRKSARDSTPEKPVAYLGGEAVTLRALRPALVELAGGQALAGLVLDRKLAERLDEAGRPVDAEAIGEERARLLARLDEDAGEAERLLKAMRERRGLGAWRFRRMLWRNAALRALVRENVSVTESDMRRAWRVEYGQKLAVRLIVVPRLQEAAALARKIRAGASWAELAAEHSTDASAARGGRLSPVSLEDTSWPEGIRQVLGELEPGEVSEPVALASGYALLRIDEVIPGESVEFEAVRSELERALRERAERIAMRRLARQVLSEAHVVVLEPELERVWEAHRQQLIELP